MGMTPEERSAMLLAMAKEEGFGATSSRQTRPPASSHPVTSDPTVNPAPSNTPPDNAFNSVLPEQTSPKTRKIPTGSSLDQLARSLRQQGHYKSLNDARAALRDARATIQAMEQEAPTATKPAKPPRVKAFKNLPPTGDVLQDPSAICPRKQKRRTAKQSAQQVDPLFNGDGMLVSQAARLIRHSDTRLSPQMLSTQIDTALISYKTGSPTEAMRLLTAIHHRYPENETARFELGSLYLQRSALSQAEGNKHTARRWRKDGMHYLAPLASSPVYATRALHMLADVLLKTGHPEEALPLIDKLETTDAALTRIKTTLKLAVAVARDDVAACAEALRNQPVSFSLDVADMGKRKPRHMGVSVHFPSDTATQAPSSYRLWNSGISHIHCVTTLAKGLLQVDRRADVLALIQGIPELGQHPIHSAYRGPALDFLHLSASLLVESVQNGTTPSARSNLHSAFNCVSAALDIKRNNPEALETLAQIAKLVPPHFSTEFEGAGANPEKDAFMTSIQKLLTRKVKSANSFKDGKRRSHPLLDMAADELASKRAEIIHAREDTDQRRPHLPRRGWRSGSRCG